MRVRVLRMLVLDGGSVVLQFEWAIQVAGGIDRKQREKGLRPRLHSASALVAVDTRLHSASGEATRQVTVVPILR